MTINSAFIKLIYLCIMFIFFYFRLRTIKSNRNTEKVRGKIYAAWTHKALFLLYFIMFFGTMFEFTLLRKTLSLPISVVGLAVCIFGFNAREWATIALGKYWSNNIEIRNVHPVIKEGPYKYIRHPNYLFLTMEFFGFAMFGNAYWIMLLLLVTYVPVIATRTIIEERKMIEELGQAYLDYKKEVPAFIPYKLPK